MAGEISGSISPSTLHVGDTYTEKIIVTNNENSTMTIYSIDVRATGGRVNWTTRYPVHESTVPPGETVTIFEHTGEALNIHVGTVVYEITCRTNFGILKTTYSATTYA